MIYLLLAGVLFPDQGWQQVHSRLVSGLSTPVKSPSASALSEAMRRVGTAPLRELFTLVKGPAVYGAQQMTRFAGRLVVAIARAAMAKPTSAAALAEAVNTAVSLAGDTIKPKLTTEEWSAIGVANYQLQIDSGNAKGLAVVLPAAQDIIVKIERAGAKTGLL